MLSRTLELLRRSPADLIWEQVIKLTQWLGDLAYWWLRTEALQLLPEEFRYGVQERWRPKPGSCAILFAQNHPDHYPALRPAFLLPLCWGLAKCPDENLGEGALVRANAKQHLPKDVLDQAHRVRTALSKLKLDENRELDSWQIYLDVEWYPQLSLAELAEELCLSAESGWAWLAAGLLLVSTNDGVPSEAGKAVPDPRIWVTACWEDLGGIRPVTLLEAKVRYAAEKGARILFVPESQQDEAKRYLPPGSSLSIEGLREHTNKPLNALAPCLLELEVPPREGESDERYRAYFSRLARWSRPRAEGYYRETLIPKIVARLSQQWHEQSPPLTHLVTILSDNPELIHIAIESTKARRCLVLATQDKSNNLDILRELRSRSEHVCELIPSVYRDPNELLEDMPRRIHEFVADAQPEHVGLDLTPGTKEMTLTMALKVAQPGQKRIYLRHKIENKLVVPFTEEWRVFGDR